MSESELTVRHEKYIATIKNLRDRNFSRDLPFLILSDHLPEGQVYKEFSDGRIEVQEIIASGKKLRSRVVDILKGVDADAVREDYGLL